MKYSNRKTMLSTLLAIAVSSVFAQTEMPTPPTATAPTQTPVDSNRAIGTTNSPAPQGNVDIVGQSAGGKAQTTVIDANGNLKMVGPSTNPNPPVSSNAPTTIQPAQPTNNNVPNPSRLPQAGQPTTPNVGAPVLPNSPPNAIQPMAPQPQPVNPAAPQPQQPPSTLPNNPSYNMQPQAPNQPNGYNQNPQPAAPPSPPVGVPNQMPQGAAPQSVPQPMEPATGNTGIVPPTPSQSTVPVQNTPNY